MRLYEEDKPLATGKARRYYFIFRFLAGCHIASHVTMQNQLELWEFELEAAR